MYKVQKAIIIAAGQGTRLQPITLERPKPLVSVNGKMIIETIIEALHKNGIYEIYIVVGYKKEMFKFLEETYKGIHLIENKYYDVANNISSIYVAREHISNSIIIDGDIIIYKPEILQPYFERSGYNAIIVEDNKPEEWGLAVENNVIVRCDKDGGNNRLQLISISRWNEEDAKKLKKHIEVEFDEKKNRKIYWDDIALFEYPSEYKLGVIEINKTDVREIDTYAELKKIDKNYK